MAKPAQPLTRERIVRLAVATADGEGIGALSMRSLAAALDAGTMSLYNHIDGKDALVDAMVEHVAAEIERPDPALGWKQGVRALAVEVRTVLRRHPWVVGPWTARMPGPERWALMETMLGLLASADLVDDLNDLAFHAILNHVLGHSRQEQQTAGADPPAGLDAAAEALDATRFPRVREHLHYHAAQPEAHDSFLFVLDLILDGLDELAE